MLTSACFDAGCLHWQPAAAASCQSAEKCRKELSCSETTENLSYTDYSSNSFYSLQVYFHGQCYSEVLILIVCVCVCVCLCVCVCVCVCLCRCEGEGTTFRSSQLSRRRAARYSAAHTGTSAGNTSQLGCVQTVCYIYNITHFTTPSCARPFHLTIELHLTFLPPPH